jgi:hypothetical protein
VKRLLCWLGGLGVHRLTHIRTYDDETLSPPLKRLVGRTCWCGHRQVVILIDGTQKQIHP